MIYYSEFYFDRSRFNLGGGEAVLTSRRPVNDGEWHVVRIDRLGIVGIMEVDNDNAVTNQASGEDFRQLNVNDGLYLGKLILCVVYFYIVHVTT